MLEIIFLRELISFWISAGIFTLAHPLHMAAMRVQAHAKTNANQIRN